MEKIIKNIFGLHTTIFLFLVFAISCGIATFLEKIYDTQTAWALIYGNSWFALLQILLGLNLLFNLIRYKLFSLQKLPILLFHISFIFILFGAGTTRYFGYEGILHIREGHKENTILSQSPYIELTGLKDNKSYSRGISKLLSTAGGNNFSFDLDVDGKKANIKFKDFITNATYDYKESQDGEPVLILVANSDGKPREIVIKKDENINLFGMNFIFSDFDENLSLDDLSIYFGLKNDKFLMKSNQEIQWFKMSENTKGNFKTNTLEEIHDKELYSVNNISFSVRKMLKKGKLELIKSQSDKNTMSNLFALKVQVNFNGQSKDIFVTNSSQTSPMEKEYFELGGVKFELGWGSRLFVLPFSIKLKEFQLDRYPGSNSPMSYASEIEVIDVKNNVHFPYRIYMNHVLDYSGYRFFQSSYDRDEKGTVLSVNKDPGKLPTYLGYFLLFAGLFLNIINPKSRFKKLSRLIDIDSGKKYAKSIGLILFFTCNFIYPNAIKANLNTSNLNYIKKIDKKHAESFGKLLVQSADGRIKPVDTISYEVLNKIYKKTNYEGITPNQATLGMLIASDAWRTQPIIRIKNNELKELIGLPKNSNHAAFDDFFDKKTNSYKLTKFTESSNRKHPGSRNQFDKDVLKADEALNIYYYVFSGEIFRIFPKANDKENRWYSPAMAMSFFQTNEKETVKNLLFDYLNSVSKSMETENWLESDLKLDKLKQYQKQNARKIIPSQNRIDMEILFNHYDIFKNLTPVYLLAGLFLFIFIFIKIILPRQNLDLIFKIVYGVNIFAFVVHTIGLAMRWYIAQHAPWSNSYESMVYIAWALSLSGIIFSRRSPISLSLTSILAGITLFVAHLSWMDPQITTIVPVLKSYWLTIHVSVITASYGFLGLCSLLGSFVLFLFIVRNPKRNDKRNLEIDRNIVEATRINEMAMILGLSLLIIGNFLGGIWANESWGRYWGWDPKETWTLISILIYSAIVHFRFIPFLNSQYAFCVASVFAYWSIIMTYFGVNFYLSGMHSYAAGDPIPIPNYIWVCLGVMIALTILAFFKRSLSKTL